MPVNRSIPNRLFEARYPGHGHVITAGQIETYIESRIRTLRGASLRRAIELSSIARHFKVEAVTLHQRYIAERKRRVETYIEERLMAFAAELLATSALPENEVAAWLGYATRLTFRKHFQKRYHQPPGRWRKAMKV